MVKFSEEYRSAAVKHREKTTASTDPEFLMGTTRVDIKLLEDVRSEATMRNFKWLSDEPPERGGRDAGPNPLSYFVSGLGFCQAVHFAGEAVRNGLKIDSMENTLRGRFDRGKERRFLEFIYDLKIESPDPPAKIRAMVKTAEKFCYVSNTLARSARLTGNVHLNGKPLFSLTRGPEKP
ncbi:MAG: OsmC family protein [Thaumarchaeota archaeon]|nr:OsmC family protein [Nitrososphaerota archaeon]